MRLISLFEPMTARSRNSPPNETLAKNLSAAPFDVFVKITALIGDNVLTTRLRELGFVSGEEVRVVGRAPFGEPFLVEVRGAVIALRKNEAQCVQV